MPPIRTHYDNLKVARNAPDAVIRASYEALIQSFQSMETKEAEFFTKVVSDSYEALSNPIRRSVYDKWIEEQENPQQEETLSQQQEVIESVASLEEYAGLWRRGLAFIVDIIAFIIIYVVIVIFGVSVNVHFFDGLLDVNNPILWTTTLLAPFVLPVIMFESLNRQASIGKKLLGLKLIDISGNRIGFGRAISRLFLKVISYYTFLFVISCLMIILSDKKQGLHDRIANTFVVIDSTRTNVKKRIVNFAIWLIVIVLLFVAMLYAATFR